MAITLRVHYQKLTCEDQAMILGVKGGVSYSWNEAQFEDRGGPAWGLPCYEEGFVYEIEHFIERCILNGKQPLSTLDDAADAMRILEAAERSASREQTFEIILYE